MYTYDRNYILHNKAIFMKKKLYILIAITIINTTNTLFSSFSTTREQQSVTTTSLNSDELRKVVERRTTESDSGTHAPPKLNHSNLVHDIQNKRKDTSNSEPIQPTIITQPHSGGPTAQTVEKTKTASCCQRFCSHIRYLLCCCNCCECCCEDE